MMYRKPLVSVVMPVYNGEKYLNEAIESILSQTMQDFELILINDGSTDGSLQIIEKYMKKDQRIKMLSHINKGLVKSLNEGVEASLGTYIARMDADDISMPDRFFKEVLLLRSNPQLDLVGTNFELLFSGTVSDETRKQKERFESNVNLPVSGFEYRILHPTWMIKKELFSKIGMYDFYYAEDVEFLFRAIWMGYKVAKIEEKLLRYRVLEESKSAVEGKTEENKRQIISFKMKYLVSYLAQRANTLEYVIWGADTSGRLLLEYMNSHYPDSRCIAFIDGKKEGVFMGTSIVAPRQIPKCEYVFVCTSSGSREAFEILNLCGLNEKEDFFKVV